MERELQIRNGWYNLGLVLGLMGGVAYWGHTITSMADELDFGDQALLGNPFLLLYFILLGIAFGGTVFSIIGRIRAWFVCRSRY